MDRMNLLYKMDDLLEVCKTCKNRNKPSREDCESCSTYLELRGIGNQLGEERILEKQTGIKRLTVPMYNDYKAKGMNQSQIAKELDCAPASVSQWVKKNVKVTEQTMKISTGGTVKATHQEKNEYELNRLQREIKQKNEEIRNLKEKVQGTVSEKEFKELQEKYDALEKTYRVDLHQKEIDIEDLNEKYNMEHQHVIDLDRIVENKSQLLKAADSSYERLEEETRLLRKLMMVYIPNGS